MTIDPDTCYRALKSRDRRFDGAFFVGVRTTGIYCRPVCPARSPARERCEFFAGAAQAERAGFRACFRCRPEVAPGVAPVDSVPRLVRRAVRRIESGALNALSVDELAASLGVSGRHLRRAVEHALGTTPVELAQTRRLALAKQLLHDTALPLSDVALAAGFSSLRRFNALFAERFGRPPSAIRREHASVVPGEEAIALRLDYRPPLDWDSLLSFFAQRALPGVEEVSGGAYRRTVRIGALAGRVSVRPDPRRAALRAEVSLSLAPALADVAARLRRLFDLDAAPAEIDRHLAGDALLAPLVAAHPGLRVPGAFDGFETAVRVVLGQQVSVAAARTIAGRLARSLGTPLDPGDPGRADGRVPDAGLLFPDAADVARATIPALRALGLPASRARTLSALANAVLSGAVDLADGASGTDADAEAAIAALRGVPGVGPWTAETIAIRVLGAPDVFPAGDLGIRHALSLERRPGGTGDAAARQRAERWRPWRSYAVLHLWNSLSRGGSR